MRKLPLWLAAFYAAALALDLDEDGYEIFKTVRRHVHCPDSLTRLGANNTRSAV